MVFDFLNKMQPTFVRILYNSTDFSVPAKFLENLPPMHVGGRLKIRLRGREEGHRHKKNSMFNVGDVGFISLVVLHSKTHVFTLWTNNFDPITNLMDQLVTEKQLQIKFVFKTYLLTIFII